MEIYYCLYKTKIFDIPNINSESNLSYNYGTIIWGYNYKNNKFIKTLDYKWVPIFMVEIQLDYKK